MRSIFATASRGPVSSKCSTKPSGSLWWHSPLTNRSPATTSSISRTKCASAAGSWPHTRCPQTLRKSIASELLFARISTAKLHQFWPATSNVLATSLKSTEAMLHRRSCMILTNHRRLSAEHSHVSQRNQDAGSEEDNVYLRFGTKSPKSLHRGLLRTTCLFCGNSDWT